MAKNTKNTAPKAPVAAPGIVTVYCALPNGIVFNLPGGRELAINGANTPRGMVAVMTAGRFGITPGVAEKDWEWVKEHYGKCAYFTADPPLLLAEADPRDGDAHARDVSGDVATGMEQANVKEAGGPTSPEGR